MAQQYIVRSPEEMIALGASLGNRLCPPQVVALWGDLGAGKTTMAKGIISALTGTNPNEIASPTFQYVHLYESPDGFVVAHFDLWRLRGMEEFRDLGLEEYLQESVALVEWPDRIQRCIPGNALHVETVIVEQGRLVCFK